MIYVIINEVGEYSDYQMNNLFASKDLHLAESKLSELESMKKIVIQLRQEMYPITNKFWKENYPNYAHDPNLSRSKNNNIYDEFQNKCKEFNEKILNELLPKYNITKENYNMASIFGNLSIDKVQEIVND